MRTTSSSVLPSDCVGEAVTDPALTQKTAETGPNTLLRPKYRGQVLARTYQPSKSNPIYPPSNARKRNEGQGRVDLYNVSRYSCHR
jgi:hypothetical protein